MEKCSSDVALHGGVISKDTLVHFWPHCKSAITLDEMNVSVVVSGEDMQFNNYIR